MVLNRRHALHLAGTTGTMILAGCVSLSDLRGEQRREYTLDIEPLEQSLIEYALYEPGTDSLFGQPARKALESILADGRYTTYGYEPLPDDAYVEHEGNYYQTKIVVTGRQRMERPLVRVSSTPEDEIPETAIAVNSLLQASARVVKILHSHAVTGGESG